jgi:IMP dehydrogenase
VRDILTGHVQHVSPASTVQECLRLMTDKRIRHLPVVEADRVVGVISIGDLVNSLISAQKAAIDQLQSYIAGGYPV